jgi:ATP-dependent DNA helicase RecQ
MDAKQILKQYWGYDNFRGKQLQIIENVLKGIDTLAIMPTGGGKSICFQVPALQLQGTCIVISPLIALMQNQVEALQKMEIPAYALHAGLHYNETKKILELAIAGKCKFLYLSPERIHSDLFQSYLPGIAVNIIAIDEAHCISQWGYDFRPSYLKIINLLEQKPEAKRVALTASATPVVAKDIITQLGFDKCELVQQRFLRPNIWYSAFMPAAKISKLLQIISNVKGTGIVYVHTRKQAAQYAQILLQYGFAAQYYHAGLTLEQREEAMVAWMTKPNQIMVCTNAFGMGIDKPDVRFVVHMHLPSSLEYYYQEAGRAGRDGNKSYAVLLFDNYDIEFGTQQLATKYPSISTLKEIYFKITYYLKVFEGNVQNEGFVFDFAEFSSLFKVDPYLLQKALKILQVQGFVTYNEKYFKPSTVQILLTGEALYDFIKENFKQGELLQGLLRMYGGIAEQVTYINEKQIAKFTQLPLAFVVETLIKLNKQEVISYESQTSLPHLFFNKSKPKEEDFIIDVALLEKLKQWETERWQKMVEYASLQKPCRSLFIGHYFNDDATEACGVCDLCLAVKRKTKNQLHPESLLVELNKLSIKNIVPFEAVQQLQAKYNHQIFWETINLLQETNAIKFNSLGQIVILTQNLQLDSA